MIDYFALIDEPRRPWLDGEALKIRFHSLSGEVHPDRVHSGSEAERQAANERYAALNAAFTCLREPKDRLRHLLELEQGARPDGIEQVPSDTMELFARIGPLCRETDSFLAERSKVTSPMLKVQMFQRALDWTDRLQSQMGDLNRRRTELDAELQSMNRAWESAPQPGDPGRVAGLPLDRLEQIYRTLSFLSRWTSQIQERIVQLSL